MSSTNQHVEAAGIQLDVLAEDGPLVYVRCQGDMVVPDYGPVGEPLARLLGQDVYERQVLLDLEKTTFLDTTGVTWLVSCHRNFMNAGGRLILHSMPPRVRNVLRLLNLDEVLHTAVDASAAENLAREDTR